jgi:hypothetical protein
MVSIRHPKKDKLIGNTQRSPSDGMVSGCQDEKIGGERLAIRPYAHAAWSVLTNLSRAF